MAFRGIINLSNLQQFAAINLLSDPGMIPGPKVAPNCAQIVLNFTLPNGKLGHIVTGGRYAGTFAGTVAQANAIFSALSTGAQYTALKAFFHPNSSFTGVSLRDINSANQPLVTSTGSAVPGTGTGNVLPSENSVVITLRTALVGQANRGRMYLTGFSTDGIGAGEIVAAGLVTAINNWAGTITGAYNASGYTWVVVQPARAQYTGSTGRVHPARIATSTPVTSALCRDNHWDSQRRRGLK